MAFMLRNKPVSAPFRRVACGALALNKGSDDQAPHVFAFGLFKGVSREA